MQVGISTIVTTILQDFHSDLIKQNVQVNNQILPNLPLIEVDVQQIERVFGNLIANAISHNSSGISLTLDAIRFGSMLKVMVQDNGVGISPIQQETIFEPYTRGHQTQYLPRLGLGLHICQQVILAHGGMIRLESSSQGAIFWFTLPLHKV
jgi:signal transduction histidine kinase